MSRTPVPALLRQQADRWAETWLTAKFSRLLELRAQDPGPFNYPIAVSRNGAAGPSISTSDTALEAAGLKMILSSGTRG